MTAAEGRGSGPAAPDTPASWRAVALGTLGGAFAAGALATTGDPLGRLAGAAAALLAASAVPIAVASRYPPVQPGPAPLPGATPARISVVVTARDEAPVIARIVRDVAAQDHREPDGTPRFELIVIDDRSTDGTGEAAMAAAGAAGIAASTRVVRREGVGLPDGKGAALTAVPPDMCRGDAILVLDADARLGTDVLRRIAAYIDAGVPALTARRRILDPGSGELAGAQADEQTLDGEIQRGRWALGGCSEFRGNGIVVRRDLLERVGGWRAQALTEDLDLSSRIAAVTGTRVAWAIDVAVWEQPVHSWGALWRQRLRWAEGSVRRTLEHGPAVLTSRALPLPARLDFAAYAGQLAMAPFVLGTLARALLTRRAGPAAPLAAAYLAVGAGLGWDSLRWERDPRGRPLAPGVRARRALRIGLFNGLWTLVVPAALWRFATRAGPVRYEKMEHA